MLTLAQSWAARLAELRAICKGNGEQVDAELRDMMYRDHARDWWAEFCRRADAGEELAPSVWRSAQDEGERRGDGPAGWVRRLKVRNA